MGAPPSGLPRLLLGIDPRGATMTRPEHERIHGRLPSVGGKELIASVERSGLRGRGGADFPTWRKLRTVAASRRSAVVVNGSEGEPVSGKDRLLLTIVPHLVLDGAVLAARAIGAQAIVVVVRGDAPDAVRAVAGAAAVRPDDGVRIRVVAGPGGYVAGEESAVMNFLNRGDARPTFVPPRPYERGLAGRPTLVQNPETLAQIALIARYGDGWFRELGTPADPGSALVTIDGAVAAPGVYELAFGTPMRDLLAAAGGASEPLRALLIGGYFGTWVDASRGDELRLAREELSAAGCALGSGVLFALGQSSCGLHESAGVMRYLASASAGQCGPCLFGLRAIADAVGDVADGVAGPREQQRIVRWADEVRGRGACHHPDGAVRFLGSALRVFGDEIDRHQHSRCAARPAGLAPALEAVR